MSIGSNIKRLRLGCELTQDQLAKIAGVSEKAVSTWELDKKIPRMGVVEKLADYFGVSKSAILTDEKTSIDLDDFTLAMYEASKKLTATQKDAILQMVKAFEKE